MLLTDELEVGDFSENTAGRDFVIGDLHGEVSTFRRALRQLNFDTENDRIFSVGDLIDRGSESKKTLQLLKEDWFYGVLGNHEHMLLQYHDNKNQRESFWFPSGGKWWIDLSETEQAEAVELVRRLYFALSVKAEGLKFGVVHADMPAETDWQTLTETIKTDVRIQREATLSRRTLKQRLTPQIKDIDYVICGHTPQPQPSLSGNVIHIDTGSGYQSSDFLPTPALTFVQLGAELRYHRFDIEQA
jgi:serine/threonine protein phosphatase 1